MLDTKEGMNMKRRSGETLTEFLVATTVFGIISAGLFEFIANQTETLADIRNKEDLMYYAQRYVNGDTTAADGITFTQLDGGKTLKVTKNDSTSLTFSLKP